MEPFTPDVAALMPHWSWRAAAEFAGSCLAGVMVPGVLLTWVFRIRSGCRAERFATIGLLGVLFTCFKTWIELAATDDLISRLKLDIYLNLGIVLPFMAVILRRSFRRGSLRKRSVSLWRCFRLRDPWESVGYAIIAGLITYYLFRTVPLFDFDGDRLRLYGAAFSDKTTNMMSCAALEHDVPPDCLRFAGHKFPSHYFPHIYPSGWRRPSAGLEVSEMYNSYITNFWFHVPALGIAINGLAILAFGRRVLKSYAVGCVALAIYGLTSVGPGLKPLDITPAAALLAISALDRFQVSGRRRWAGLAIVLIGTMPCFETFHAALLLAALSLRACIQLAAAVIQHRRGALQHGPQQGSPRVVYRRPPLLRNCLIFPALAGLAAFGSLQLLYVGERPVAPPRIVIDNVYGDSFRNTWEGRANDDDTLGRALATLDRWKRKPKGDDPVPIAWYERTFAKLLFAAGIPIYVFCRFVRLATFGIVHLWRRRRTLAHPSGPGWRPSEQIIAAAGLIGFAAPWLVDVGIQAGGQWWSSPNLYRPTEFASWLLATLGAGLIVDLATHRTRWRQPSTWALALVAGYWLTTITAEHLAQTTQYLEVPRDQLNALAYMRQRIPYGEVIVHPWSDCEIRDASLPKPDGRDAVSFIYKRHFTLGSNLAGRAMFYEGREDYTFSNGFIDPEEVFRRSRARKKFYQQTPTDTKSDPATLADVLEVKIAPVQYVVEDAGFPAPRLVRETWPIVYQSGAVTIRRRPSQ